MGQPDRSDPVIQAEPGGEPGELKHLSTRRKRKQTSDSVSRGDRTRHSPNPHRGNAVAGVVGPSAKDSGKVSRTIWKGGPQRVTAP